MDHGMERGADTDPAKQNELELVPFYVLSKEINCQIIIRKLLV